MMASPRAADTPHLVSVGVSASGGDACNVPPLGGPWDVTVSWDTNNPNDADYDIEVDVATDAAGVSFSGFGGPFTTADSNAVDNTGISGNVASVTNPVTFYRKYRVRLVRTGVGTIETLLTSQVSLTYGDEPCPP